MYNGIVPYQCPRSGAIWVVASATGVLPCRQALSSRSRINGTLGRICKLNASVDQPAPLQPEELVLDRDIPLSLTEVSVGDNTMPLIVADCDVVMQMYIDAGKDDRDPYWTCPWPSSMSLAEEILERPELVLGKRIADVGCGLGLAGIAAAKSGAEEVYFLDREPLALKCALMNAELNGIDVTTHTGTSVSCPPFPAQFEQHKKQVGAYGQIQARIFDWSEKDITLEKFDVVLACDVLYEKFSVEPIAWIAPLLLKEEGGMLLLADPPLRAKANRDRFVELMESSGFTTNEIKTKRVLVTDEGKPEKTMMPITFMSFVR